MSHYSKWANSSTFLPMPYNVWPRLYPSIMNKTFHTPCHQPLPQKLDLAVSLTLNISANLHFSVALSVQRTFADRYHHFKGTCCHHILPCRWRRGISAKYCSLSTNFRGTTSQKTVILVFTVVRTSNFIFHLWMLNNQILKCEVHVSLCSLHHTLWGTT